MKHSQHLKSPPVVESVARLIRIHNDSAFSGTTRSSPSPHILRQFLSPYGSESSIQHFTRLMNTRISPIHPICHDYGWNPAQSPPNAQLNIRHSTFGLPYSFRTIKYLFDSYTTHTSTQLGYINTAERTIGAFVAVGHPFNPGNLSPYLYFL